MAKPKIGRPELPVGERRVTLTARVHPRTLAKAKRRAKDKGASLGAVLDDAIDRLP